MAKLMLGCTLLEQAAPFAETYLTRERKSGKRPLRIRTPKWRRQQRRPGEVVSIDCQNLDIVL